MKIFTELPDITPFEFDGAVEAGRDAQVVCYVPRGDSPLRIQWLLNGQEINNIMGINTMNVGSRSNILSITSVKYSHSGEYTCSVSNMAGERRHSAKLIVYGR